MSATNDLSKRSSLVCDRDHYWERDHVHRRDWRPCPATRHGPLRLRKAAARWLFRWADAIQHHETLIAFLDDYPADFPVLAGDR